MNDHPDRIQCPLCAGHGVVRPSRITEFLADPQLERKIEAYVASASAPDEETAETVVAGGSKPRDFQKDVHTWNPTLPMWRRSPKE